MLRVFLIQGALFGLAGSLVGGVSGWGLVGRGCTTTTRASCRTSS
jgi:ABC-type antimicrobial peptide transport system permease subunit